MPTITDDAVCIRRWDFSETSQTVSLLTREHGIIRGLAKGSKRQKGAFSGGLDLLTRGQIVAIVKPGRDLATLTAWHLEDIYPAPRTSLAANRAALYMADLVHYMLLEHDPHPLAFDQLLRSLDRLEDPRLIEFAMLEFQWMLLVETGYRPALDRDAQTNKPLPSDTAVLGFNAAAGGLVAEASADTSKTWGVRRETVETLRALESGELSSDNLTERDAETLRRANRLLAAYFRHIIGSEPHAMRWSFSDL